MIQAVAMVLDFAPDHWEPSRRLVAIALADHVNASNLECWPSLERLQKRTGLSRASVKRHLRALEEDGVIARLGQLEKANGSWGTNRWRWLWLPELAGGSPMNRGGGSPTNPHVGVHP